MQVTDGNSRGRLPFPSIIFCTENGQAKTAKVTRGSDLDHNSLFDSKTGKRFLEQRRVNHQAAAVRL